MGFILVFVKNKNITQTMVACSKYMCRYTSLLLLKNIKWQKTFCPLFQILIRRLPGFPMQNRAAKAVIKHKVNQKMSGNNNNGDKCQCVLGSFTTTFGVITNACGAGVGIGALAFLGEPTTSTTDTRFALMFMFFKSSSPRSEHLIYHML